jgi:hypothetical protein
VRARLRRFWTRSGFSPGWIAGLQLWLRCEALAGLADGDPVGIWPDASRLGHDATQLTAAKKPTFRAGIVNGRPAVHFDGVDDRMNLPILALATAHTLFVVCRLQAALNYVVIGDGASFYAPYLDGTSIYYLASATGASRAHGLAGGEWALHSLRRSGTTMQFFKNGAQLGGDALMVGNQEQSLNSLGGYDSDFFLVRGDVAEVLIYDAALAATDRAGVEGYLKERYWL